MNALSDFVSPDIVRKILASIFGLNFWPEGWTAPPPYFGVKTEFGTNFSDLYKMGQTGSNFIFEYEFRIYESRPFKRYFSQLNRFNSKKKYKLF